MELLHNIKIDCLSGLIFEFNIGRTMIDDDMPTRQYTEFIDIKKIKNITINEYEYHVDKIAKFECPGDTYIHLYKITEINNWNMLYIPVNHKSYHNNGVYYDKLIYDEILHAETDYDAFIEFAEFCKPHMF